MRGVASRGSCVLVAACLLMLISSAEASSLSRVSNPAPRPAPAPQEKKETQKTEAAPPPLSKKDRERGYRMLEEIKADIKQFYYDPKFHGIDLEARFKLAREKMDSSQSLGQMFGIIAQLLIEFNDSHTFFIPPRRALRTDYGWQMQMIGADCLVVDVEKESDSATKGLKPGDKVMWVNGYTPLRENFWQLSYLLNILRPQPAMYVYVQSPGETKPRPLTLLAKQEEQPDLLKEIFGKQPEEEKDPPKDDPERETHFRDHRFHEFGNVLIIWQMPVFDLSEGAIDRIMKEKIASRQALILDLRGNGGGYELTLLRLLGHVLDHDTKVGDIKRRKSVKEMVVKSRGEKAYKGKIVVLVDSNSASSAELFARMIQLERRGSVLGDQTAGAVMRALQFPHLVDEPGMMTANIIAYVVSITDSDIVMRDGRSLERNGVTPDELILPKPEHLAVRHDPVLARAAEIAGFKLDPEKAGKLFPPRPPKEKKQKPKNEKTATPTPQNSFPTSH